MRDLVLLFVFGFVAIGVWVAAESFTPDCRPERELVASVAQR